MKSVSILVVDDHALIREGVKLLLNAQPDFWVVGEANRAEDACAQVASKKPDIVLMDVAMPGLGGAAATKRLKALYPALKVIAVSAHEDAVYVRQLFQCGAVGYVLKRTGGAELVRAIRAVLAGETYVAPSLTEKLAATAAKRSPALLSSVALSEREKDVMRFTARGYANKEIAQLLNLSVKTVETYKTRMSRKLGLSSRADIVRYAMAAGWLGETVREGEPTATEAAVAH